MNTNYRDWINTKEYIWIVCWNDTRSRAPKVTLLATFGKELVKRQ